MKNIKKFILGIGLVLAGAMGVRADNDVSDVFNVGNNGTTSATAIVPPGRGMGEIRDLLWKIDAGLTSATVDIRTGKAKIAVSSATSASGTTLWFTNPSGVVAQADYVILETTGTGTFTLLRAKSVTTTSITTQETISPATTTSDFVFTLNAAVRRPAPEITSSGTVTAPSIWLPADVPSAITIEGNTTSCRVSASGVRSFYK